MRRAQYSNMLRSNKKKWPLGRWWTDSPLSAYIHFHLFMRSKNVQKMLQFERTFPAVPIFHNVQLLLGRWKAIFAAAVGWWTDLPFITIFKQIFIIHEVTSNLHRIFPSEQMKHKLTISPFKEENTTLSGNKFAFSAAVTVFVCRGRGSSDPNLGQERNGEITLISEWKQAQKSRISPFQLFNALEKTLNEKKHKNGKDQIYRFSFSTLLETAQNSQLGHIHVISLTSWNTLISHQRFGFMLFYIVEYVTVLLCSVCLFAINCFSFACSIVDSINAIMEYSL